MKLFGKNITVSFQITRPGEPFLIGFHNWEGEKECCGEAVNVTEIGIGFGKAIIFAD